MPVKSPVRIAAENLCKQFPDTPSRTLAKKLSASHQVTIEAARDAIRISRGNHGDNARKQAVVKDSFRPNQPAGWKPQMPESLSEEWTPFSLGNGIKVAILSDLHIPYHSKLAVQAAIDYTKKRKVDVLLINGDLADFYSISRFQTDPSKRDLEAELTAVREGIAWLRYCYGNKCRIVFSLGNHDSRWQKYLWNAAPEISNNPRMDIREWVDADKYGIEVVGDQRPVMAGKLPVLHGDQLGKGGGVNPARWLFMKTTSTMLIGHGHRTSQHTEPDWRHVDTTCWTQGCLAAMHPEYARVTKWNWGAVFVEVDNDGEFEVDNFRIGPSGQIWS